MQIYLFPFLELFIIINLTNYKRKWFPLKNYSLANDIDNNKVRTQLFCKKHTYFYNSIAFLRACVRTTHKGTKHFLKLTKIVYFSTLNWILKRLDFLYLRLRPSTSANGKYQQVPFACFFCFIRLRTSLALKSKRWISCVDGL